MSQTEQSPRQIAEANQQLAANPNGSAVVEANAGSGKTHVLINRVTRILLAGAAPEQILCVTYTKAAASEMLNRLFKVLGRFSILPDQALAIELKKLDPVAPTDQDGLAKARRLFARALETPGGLKIRTIHGFCETLLRQFPVESGISPGFRVMDETQSQKLADRLIANIGAEAVANVEGPLANAYAILGENGAGTAPRVFQTAINNAGSLAVTVLQPDGLQKTLQATAGYLGVEVEDTVQSVSLEGWSKFDITLLNRLGQSLAKGASTNQKKAIDLFALLEETDPELKFQALVKIFLTAKFKRPKALFSKPAAADLPEWEVLVEPVFELIETILNQIWAAQALQMTEAALRLSEAFVRQYVGAKKETGLVDFDDLISLSKDLLTSKISSQWVLYKMDGNLRHVLVDEAQDNSQSQWSIIGALTEEFFAGKGANGQIRTLFAVGDPKQSIYRFQGADPALFSQEKERMQQIGKTGSLPVYTPQLTLSWRSAPEILQFVDACFSPLDDRETKFSGDPKAYTQTDPDPGFSHYMEHQAERSTARGSVTLHPAIAYEKKEQDTEPWRPVNAVKSDAPVSLLAKDVAMMVKDMLARGDQIGLKVGDIEEKRAVQAGDILILVRSRNDLFREIIRHLKLQNVAVAGADRMILQSETVVLDFLSVAKMALQPADDLSLAEVLKGPFLHPEAKTTPVISEQILYDLAQGRGKNQSLYAALMASEIPELDEAKTWVTDLIARAGHENPYWFFSGLINRRSQTGEAHLRRLYARLGPEAEDPLQEFLNLALGFNQAGDGTLLSFIVDMNLREDTIKREMEEARNAVRVMTVHGAKGLEAPVVILPDTNSKATTRKHTGLVQDLNCWFWANTGEQVCKPVTDFHTRQEVLDAQEHRRLLYVALTRARDHLIICGHARGDGPKDQEGLPPDCWYRRCETAFKYLVKAEQADLIPDPDNQFSYRLGSPSITSSCKDQSFENNAGILPNWVDQPLVDEPDIPLSQTPSSLRVDNNSQVAVASPVGPRAKDRFLRGNLIHALLEALPEISPKQRDQAARRFLRDQPDLSEQQIDEIAGVTCKVLANPEFADLFGPESRAELPIVGEVEVRGKVVMVRGKIDRLLIREKEVLVLDFKTNRPPPKQAEDVPQAYLDQMATYRSLLRLIWPDKNIRCALLWTEGPDLMELPGSLLDHTTV